MDFNFSRQNRLCHPRAFQSVFTKPGKASHSCFLALFAINTQIHPRLGIILSKTKVKRAIDRNTIRRIVRESFRHHKDQLKELDIVVLMRSKWSPLNHSVLRKAADQLWLKVAAKKGHGDG